MLRMISELDRNMYEDLDFIFDPNDVNDCIEAVKKDGWALKYIENQTVEICLVAVELDGGSLRFVKEQTLDICLKAVEDNPFMLRYVKKQSLEICKVALASAIRGNLNIDDVVKLMNEEFRSMLL